MFLDDFFFLHMVQEIKSDVALSLGLISQGVDVTAGE